eukprot:14395486-Heterocapsa_arctica.AAC.1
MNRPGASTLAMILHDGKTQSFVGLIIMINFVLICIDVDNMASEAQTPVWVDGAMHACFITYVV